MRSQWITLLGLIVALAQGAEASQPGGETSATGGKNPHVLMLLDRVESAEPGLVTYRLRAEGADEMAGYGFLLHFDAGQLTFLDAAPAPGGLLPLVNGSTGLFVASSPSPGQVAVGAVALDGSVGRGAGELTTFAFRTSGPVSPGEIGISDAVLVDLSGATDPAAGLEVKTDGLEDRAYGLGQNTPNPFNPETTISYVLPEPGHVRIEVYNALGQVVRVLVDDVMGPGAYSVVWDGRDALGRRAASGVYLYRMVAPEYREVRRMMMIK